MKSMLVLALAVAGLGTCREERARQEPVRQQLDRPADTRPEPAPLAKAETAQSQFTSLESKDCRMIEQNLDEGPYTRELCAGAGGYQLEVSESDLRQDIEVIAPGGAKTALGLSETVAKGAFNSLGKLAEWRGADSSRPRALIVRLNVAGGPNGDETDISNLVVARLAAPVCIVAVVPPGPGQNAQARRIADGKLPACLPPQ